MGLGRGHTGVVVLLEEASITLGSFGSNQNRS